MAVAVLHKNLRIKSLQTFHKLLPEFSEVPSKPTSVADKAFHKSLVSDVTDVREWKPIRDEALSKQPLLTPRELARFKFSLCYRGKHLTECYLGRPALHQWLDGKALNMIPHMNSVELLSTLTGFSSTINDSFYTELMTQLITEIDSEEDLNLLAVAVYVANSYYSPDTTNLPVIKTDVQKKLVCEFMKNVAKKLVNRVTELNDEQFATVAAGLGRVGFGYENVDCIYELSDAMQEDFIRRRAGRMSLDNLIDVAFGFFSVNLAQDELAKIIIGRIIEKKAEISYDNGMELVQAISARQICSDDLLKIVNGLVKKEMHKEDYMRVGSYIFNTQCKDEELLKSHMKLVMENRPFPKNNFEKLKIHKFYLEKYFPGLVTSEFCELLDKCGYLFDPQRYLYNNEIFKTPYFQDVKKWIRHLKIEHVDQHLHNGHEVIDFAIKPQNVAIQLALPKYHLIGKWEEDLRIIKEPKRKYKISNHFEYKCWWLELLGFKVIRLNYQEISENFNSKEERDRAFLDLLKPLGVSPILKKSSKYD